MPHVVIENPILNSPYSEPTRHFRFTEEGITDQIVESRRVSAYFIPIPSPRKKNPKQLAFETEWTQDRLKENDFITKCEAGSRSGGRKNARLRKARGRHPLWANSRP